MPIKIHHGPPGSYKTAGAMGDDFLREAKTGRVIVTNVRGVTRERVLEEFPDLPESFDVIHCDDKTPEDRQRWATWFHWIPPGAFIFVDEAQMIWPKNWREADIRKLDYPGGQHQAMADGRPYTWEEAFEKHRHYNWDMVFTTPNFKKIRDDIKQCAEMAYKHKNLATLGIRGRYIEAAHLADDDGGSPSHFLSVNSKKVPPYVFKIYESTATGAITDTQTGISIFKNPRVAILLFILMLVPILVFRNGMPAIFGGSTPVAVSPVKSSPKDSGPIPAQAGYLPTASSPAVTFDIDQRLEPFVEAPAYISMSYKVGRLYKYAVTIAGQSMTNNDMLDLGYTIKQLGSCGLELSRNGFRRIITCQLEEKKQENKTEMASNQPMPGTSQAISVPPVIPENGRTAQL
ncbi:MAG: hypothetical protein RLZZ298_2977 [Pseudomonadota bacterium]|jgi:zona occludens toxin